MDRWRKILDRWRPRDDADNDFYPQYEEVEQPALLNSMGPMSAAFVAARVLRAIAARRGSILKPSAIEQLESLVARGLSEEVVRHCEAEAERILEWIDSGPDTDEDPSAAMSGVSDFDTMVSADLESRLSVAQFALEEEYDLELEYFDDEDRSWPRLKAAIRDIEDAEAKDFQTALVLYDGDEFRVPLKYVRWLMPVAPQEWDDEEEGGDVLEFPQGGRADDDGDE